MVLKEKNMEEKVKDELVNKGEMLDKLISTNALLVVGAVEKIVDRKLTDDEKDSIINSAKAFHLLTVMTAKFVL